MHAFYFLKLNCQKSTEFHHSSMTLILSEYFMRSLLTKAVQPEVSKWHQVSHTTKHPHGIISHNCRVTMTLSRLQLSWDSYLPPLFSFCHENSCFTFTTKSNKYVLVYFHLSFCYENSFTFIN